MGSSALPLQGQTPPTGRPAFSKGVVAGVRPMYPPSSSAAQNTTPIPAYPMSSAYGLPTTTQGTPSAAQPGSVPPPMYSQSGTATRTQQYSAPPLSKPAPVGPGTGVRNATATTNYTSSLSDGFSSMHLQVCTMMLAIRRRTSIRQQVCSNCMPGVYSFGSE